MYVDNISREWERDAKGEIKERKSARYVNGHPDFSDLYLSFACPSYVLLFHIGHCPIW